MGGAAPVPKPGERPTLHKKQLPKLLFLTLSRWLVTASIIGAMYGVLVHYYNLAAMTNSQKRVFNAVIVSLTISLALNIASSLKAMAGELRWWVLSLRHWPIREADLILQSEYMSQLFKLALVSRIWRARLLALFWIFINVVCCAWPLFLFRNRNYLSGVAVDLKSGWPGGYGNTGFDLLGRIVRPHISKKAWDGVSPQPARYRDWQGLVNAIADLERQALRS
jgi:hypothetical protein